MADAITDPEYHQTAAVAAPATAAELTEPVVTASGLTDETYLDPATNQTVPLVEYPAILATPETDVINAQPHNALDLGLDFEPTPPAASPEPEPVNLEASCQPEPTATDPDSSKSLTDLLGDDLLPDLERALTTIRQSSAASIPGTYMHAASATLEEAIIRLRTAHLRESSKLSQTQP